MSFTIAIAPIKLVPAFKHRYDLSKIEEGKSTVWSLMYSGRKLLAGSPEVRNRLFSIPSKSLCKILMMSATQSLYVITGKLKTFPASRLTSQ